MENQEVEQVEETEDVTEVNEVEQEDVQDRAEDNQGDSEENPDEGWRQFAENRAREREARQERERKEREKADELKKLQEILGLNAPANETAAEKKEREQRIESLKEIDLPTGQDVESFVYTIIDKVLNERDQKRQQERQQEEQRSYPQRLSRDYPDIKEVVSQENLDYLEYHYPEIAEMYGNMPDGYDKYSKLYSTMRKLIPQTNKTAAERAKRNLSAPQATGGRSATPSRDARATGLSKEQKRANYERMLREMKMV